MAFQKMEGHAKGLVKYSRVFAKKETQVIDVAFWVEDETVLTGSVSDCQHWRSSIRVLIVAGSSEPTTIKARRIWRGWKMGLEPTTPRTTI